MTLYWLPAAHEDRVEIYDHIERDSPDTIIIIDDRILKAVNNLASFPEMGRRPEKLHKGTRHSKYTIHRSLPDQWKCHRDFENCPGCSSLAASEDQALSRK